MWTSRAGLAGWRLERMRWRSQALEACSRVLKKRAAQSHLSMRMPVMGLFSFRKVVKAERLNADFHGWHGTKQLGMT